MDPTCVPLNGVPKFKENVEEVDDLDGPALVKPSDPVIEPVTPEERIRPQVDTRDWVDYLVIFGVLIIITIALVIIFCRICMRGRKK